MAKRHHSVHPVATRAVFIDPRIPDLQTLIDGAAPDEAVFVLDPAQDGLAQIAADLAGARLSGLASISIVSHGAAGSLQLGATTLDDGGLAAHAAALRAIGAALKGKGQLDLYACDIAAGAAGKRFVADLSRYAGGAHVAAATHAIGHTAAGESWTLDASAGAKAAPAASPFTAAATDTYQGSLATGPTGQLYGLARAEQTDSTSPTGLDYYVGSYVLNANSSTPTILSATPESSTALAIDPVLGIKFELQYYNTSPNGNVNDSYLVPFTSSLDSSSAPVAAQSFVSFYQSIGASENGQDSQAGTGIAVDTLNHKIYAFVGSDMTPRNGMVVASYSQDANGTVTIGAPSFVETSTGNVAPSFFNRGATYWNGNVYVEDVLDGVGPNAGKENGLYRISTNGSQPVSILDGSLGKQLLGHGVAIDHAADRLYFSTSFGSTLGISTDAQGKLYALNNVDTETNGAPIALTYAPNVTVPTFKDIEGLAYDENAHVLYVANDDEKNFGNSQIDELTLNGTQVTSVTVIPYSSFGTPATNVAPFFSLADTPLPTLTVGGTAATAAKGVPLTVLSGAPTISDITSGGFEKSVTVSVTDNATAVSGDVLGLAKGGTFQAFTATAQTYVDNGHTFLVSYANGVLTIANPAGSAGENTIGAFNQVLQDVQYQNNSTDSNTRLVTVQVNNGAIGNPSGPTNTKSFTLAVAKPPTLAAGGYKVPADVLAGATTAVTTAPGALAGDSDPNGGSLSITAVQTSGGTAGTVGAALTGTYGSLTLNANGTYSYSASNATAIANAKTGSHPLDSYSFTVTNAGGSAAEAFIATIDRAPTGTGITVVAPEGATTSGAGGAAFKNETDADGDKLAVSSVSYTDPTTMTTTVGTVGQSIAGRYGELTLNADGSFSYVADNTVNYATALLAGQQAVDDFTYTSSDGFGGTTSPQTLEFDVTCFVTGTRIATTRGDVPVETLAVGDLVVTASGAARPIRWIGHRAVACAARSCPSAAWPVRIRAAAFGDAVPARDLLLSPGHPVLVGADVDGAGGHLVPIMCLINGTTIERLPVERVTYWHVELDGHDIVRAEGLAAESYIDLGSRPWFAGADGALHDPDLALPGQPGRCRPVAIDGPVVEAERRRLDAAFATRLADACKWPNEERLASLRL